MNSLLSLLNKEQFAVNRINTASNKFDEELNSNYPNYHQCRVYTDDIRSREEELINLRKQIAEYISEIEVFRHDYMRDGKADTHISDGCAERLRKAMKGEK